jgi:hypothetical protein
VDNVCTTYVPDNSEAKQAVAFLLTLPVSDERTSCIYSIELKKVHFRFLKYLSKKDKKAISDHNRKFDMVPR